MHEVQVIQRCDFDRKLLDDNAQTDIPITLFGKRYLLDVCSDCWDGTTQFGDKFGFSQILEAIQKVSRQSDVVTQDKTKQQKRTRRSAEERAKPKVNATSSWDPNTRYPLGCDEPGCPFSSVNKSGLAVHTKTKHGRALSA